MTTFDADHAATFLTAVYAGSPGLLQLCRPRPGGGMLNAEFPTTQDGIAAAVAHAHSLDTAVPSIYFRATTMTEHPPQSRRGGAELTAAVPVLWADLDYGVEGHKLGPNDQLPNPPTAADAFSLVAAAGLPDPTIVIHSGGGWYPLWRPAVPLAVDQAAELSTRIQELLLIAATARGWHYGTGVKDLARVLRLPGSVNRKTDNPRPCRVIGGTGLPVDVATIPALPAAAPAPTPGPQRQLAPAATYDPARRTGPLDALAENTTWADLLEPADWTHVATEHDGAERWLRPGGASSEYSARAFENVLVVHSDNAGLPSGSGQRLTKGRLFAHLHHRGDTAAAARDILAAAHGTGGTPAARALPDAVLHAAQTAHADHDAAMWGQLGVTAPAAQARALAAVPPLGAPVTDAPPAAEQVAPRSKLWGNVLPHDSLRGAPPPTPPYILDGLVRTGDLVALVSAAKAGKSLLTLDRVLTAVARGTHVVYLDAENGLRDIHTRVHALGHSQATLGGLVYVSFPSVVLDEPGGAYELLQFVYELHQQRPVDLVILDTASRFLAGEENDSAPWLAQYRLALLPLKRQGIAVLRLDHLGKDPGKGARGSSAKNGDVDAVFELVPEGSIVIPGQPTRLALTCTMQRSGTYPALQTLVRGEINGVLGHHHPGDFVGTTPVIDPGNPADQIIRALDDIEAPTSTGRDKARQLVGNRFPNVAMRVWEAAIRRRKEVADLIEAGEEPARKPARDTPSQTHLHVQVSAARAGACSCDVSAGQTCTCSTVQEDPPGSACSFQHPEGVLERAAPAQTAVQSTHEAALAAVLDPTPIPVGRWRISGQAIEESA